MPINFPANIYPQNEQWISESNPSVFRSELNNIEQVTEMPGTRWRCSMPFVNLTREKGRQLNAFLMSLNGTIGQAYIVPYDSRTSLGSPGGSPLVNGANQTGGTLVTDGWTASTLIFKAGDYFNAGGELKVITEDINSDASGNATLVFSPNLHKSPASNTSITYDNPWCLMRMANKSQAAWQLTRERHYLVTLNFVEVID